MLLLPRTRKPDCLEPDCGTILILVTFLREIMTVENENERITSDKDLVNEFYNDEIV